MSWTAPLVVGGLLAAGAVGVVALRAAKPEAPAVPKPPPVSQTSKPATPKDAPAVKGKCGTRDYCRARPWNCVGNAAAAVALAAASGATGGAASPASIAHGGAFALKVRNWCKEQR
jgi:hypothetical protein